MSKRSFRRLAALAGAALTVGTMAPALAAHSAGTNENASASAAVDLNPAISTAQGVVSLLRPQATAGAGLAAAFGLVGAARTGVGNIVTTAGTIRSCAPDVLGGDLPITAAANIVNSLGVGLSGLTLGAANAGGAGAGASVGVGDLGVDCITSAALSTATGAPAMVQAAVAPAAALAIGTATSTVGNGVVLSQGLLSNPLFLLGGTSASVNAVAGLMGSL